MPPDIILRLRQDYEQFIENESEDAYSFQDFFEECIYQKLDNTIYSSNQDDQLAFFWNTHLNEWEEITWDEFIDIDNFY